MSMHEQWTDMLSDYLDGDLPEAERKALEAHLLECAGCARTLEELREVIDAAKALPSMPPGIDLWRGISARIDQRAAGAALRLAGNQVRRAAAGGPCRGDGGSGRSGPCGE
jgi:anti-sigma factor RsiW